LKEESEERKLSMSDLVAKSFGVIMVVLYFVIGTTIIIKAPDMRDIPKPYALIFGIFMIFYGFVRAYKLYRKHFSVPDEE
jgi:hypothetical protein